jgi:protein PhnA
MAEFLPCPKCKEDYTYSVDGVLICPMCFHEWHPEPEKEEITDTTEKEEITGSTVKDANGNILNQGDTVIIIKDLPVKGTSKSVKAGTKVKNIRLTDGDHNIDCKIDGFGAMGLKSQFVRKV